ncbi:hypothetical protein SMD20_26705 [Nonomuraea sp. LP-02]|uniref:hypothetical protein n=1 Tax=Nonomuraea sp. LP-02 TaxID=3097960 RepID=UPI002E315587|nr:hypothetical protein [Nonomuraea sp. LP-02]MED7927878.1 hypothetical protein [Nonomuraea sp. LP-02]
MVRRKSQQEPPPSDAETAEHMRNLAELFVEHMRENGYSFDWDPAFIHHLDNYRTEFAGSKPPPEVIHSVIMGAGAYLSEMIVRNSDWTWVYCTDENAAVESPEQLRGYPHDKVAKRIHNGTEHDLEAFLVRRDRRGITQDSCPCHQAFMVATIEVESLIVVPLACH